jgi:hypothetical protein
MSVWSRMGWFLAALPATAVVSFAQTPSVVAEDFPTLVKRLQAEKPTFAKRQQDLLAQRYDLADRPARVAFPCPPPATRRRVSPRSCPRAT